MGETQKARLWFSHDALLSNSLEMRSLISKYGLVAEARYIRVLSVLRLKGDFKLDYDDKTFEMLSDDWGCKPGEAHEFIDTTIKRGLLNKNGASFFSQTVITDMEYMQNNIENKRRAGLKGAESRWGKRPSLKDGTHEGNNEVRAALIEGFKRAFGRDPDGKDMIQIRDTIQAIGDNVVTPEDINEAYEKTAKQNILTYAYFKKVLLTAISHES
jgi:polyhydroxyalkanoate synthesis regulator phasin